MGGNQVGVMQIAKGSTVPVPAIPVRAGYTFLGWYKDTECTQAWNFAIDKANENTMLYAKWLQGAVAKPQTGDEGIFSSISSGIYNFLKSINIL